MFHFGFCHDFLELEQELWGPSGKRLTVLFDPVLPPNGFNQRHKNISVRLGQAADLYVETQTRSNQTA